MKTSTASTGIIIFYLLALVGWVMNIVTVCTSSFDELTGMLIARCIGIVVAPLGMVLGWI